MRILSHQQYKHPSKTPSEQLENQSPEKINDNLETIPKQAEE